MNKKGQALVEAAAGLLVSVLLFTSCLKLWATAVTELKAEQKARQIQLCNLTGTANCKKEGGFILITLLMQLSVLIFATHGLMAIFLNDEFKWNITNWCFENALASVTGAPSNTATSISDIERELNSKAPQLLQIQTNIQGPIKNENASRHNSEVIYRIGWVTTTNFYRLFQHENEFFYQLKCGARKVCEKHKCTFTVIADKS